MSTVLEADRPTAETPAVPPPARRIRWGRPEGQPRWVRPAAGALGALTLLLYCWDLSRNGTGNAYYAAAVKSGTESWKAFLFGSLDPGSFITVDKPPAAFWIQTLSARVFGFSSWSILAPQAVAGAASVLVVVRLVGRWMGWTAGLLAGTALALTPVAVVMFRFNNPDGIMTLFLVLAAWATWSAVESGRTRHLVYAGILLGLAFDAKMLEAFVALPAFGLVYLWAGPPKLGRRIVQLLWGGLALLVSAGWWVAVVALWPASDRPYVGSTTDNSILSLIFGYNGLSRIFGASRGGGAARAGAGAARAGFAGRGGGFGGLGGSAGWTRLFTDSLGGQVAWLVPLAMGGLVVGLWLSRRAPRTDRTRAGWLLWGAWAVVAGVVFSKASGTFHGYYTVAMAPAVAALAGGTVVALWPLGYLSRAWSWLLAVGVGGSAAWAVVLLRRTPGYDSPLVWGIAVAGAVATLALLVGPWVGRRTVLATGAVIAGLTLLAGPAAYAMTTVDKAVTGSNASAGPTAGATGAAGFGGGGFAARFGEAARRLGGFGDVRRGDGGASFGSFGGFGGSTTADTALDSYLEAHRRGAKWLVAVQGASAAEPIILATGEPVIAMGGFSGSDPTPTVARLSSLVGSGQLHYVLLAGGGGFGGFGRGGSRTSAIPEWVEAHGHAVSYGNTDAGTLYEVTSG